MESPFASIEPEDDHKPPFDDRGARLREVPLRKMVPNIITILAICAGMTGIRLAFEGRFELAVGMVLAAAFLDGIDGRAARLLKAETRFGAEMDSLADIVNFGVAPALVIYAYVLEQWRPFGWFAAVIYAIACGLRLARFNVLNGLGARTGWRANYFVGVPAPAGAGLVLLPIYLGAMGMERSLPFTVAATLYTGLIAFLLISRVPVWSGKNAGFKRDVALPVMIGVVTLVLMLASLPWLTLTALVAAYLVFVPFSARNYASRAAREAAQSPAAQSGA